MIRRSFLVHALSPLHAGTGQGVDVIDLPIARMSSTGIPIVPGSSIKGVLRDASRLEPRDVQAVFGPDTSRASENAGALVVGDARLLALPVRSFFGTFAWVTSPLLLVLASRDLAADGGRIPSVPAIEDGGAMVADLAKCVVVRNNRVYLDDLDPKVRASSEVAAWEDLLAGRLRSAGNADDERIFRGRFVVVHDELMTYLWETATQVDARNRLTDQGTVAAGALWYEESLPPETLLVGLIGAEESRMKDVEMRPREVLDGALSGAEVLQLGGKSTVGRGICRFHVELDGHSVVIGGA